MFISLVVAMGRKRVIGCCGQLPWDLPADRRHFRELTMGHTVIMGRRTFESIGRPLDGRLIVVLTTGSIVTGPQVCQASTIDKALTMARDRAPRPANEIFVAGGASVYRQTIGLAKRLYLTMIDGDFDGDAFFPDIPADMGWSLISNNVRVKDAANPWSLVFSVYERP